MVYKPNSSTPDYWFEKADQCFRRSRTDLKARVKLEALGNVFMVKAVELDIKLRNLAMSLLQPHRSCALARASSIFLFQSSLVIP